MHAAEACSSLLSHNWEAKLCYDGASLTHEGVARRCTCPQQACWLTQLWYCLQRVWNQQLLLSTVPPPAAQRRGARVEPPAPAPAPFWQALNRPSLLEVPPPEGSGIVSRRQRGVTQVTGRVKHGVVVITNQKQQCWGLQARTEGLLTSFWRYVARGFLFSDALHRLMRDQQLNAKPMYA